MTIRIKPRKQDKKVNMDAELVSRLTRYVKECSTVREPLSIKSVVHVLVEDFLIEQGY
jgi:predicted nuclease of restriction endonuclease-like RecB superfamily